MTEQLETLLQQYEERRLSRRELVATLVAVTASVGPGPADAQAPRVRHAAQARTLNHVSIAVSDVERSAAFYRGILGLDIVSRPANGGINLGLGDGFLGLYALPNVGQVHHFCLGVDEYDPDAIAETLGEQRIDARVDRNANNRTSGGDQLYFNDPDGTIVQLSANRYQG